MLFMEQEKKLGEWHKERMSRLKSNQEKAIFDEWEKNMNKEYHL